jgi:Tfp pilus assembly protein PilF
LAQAFEFAGKSSDAEQAYRSGIEQHPDSVILRTNFGLMLVRYERIDEGRAEMVAVLTPAEVHYNVGSVLELKGDRPAAREEYARALRLDPEFIDARKRLAALGD